MKTTVMRLRWGALYLTLPLMGGLFYLEATAPLSALGHRLAQLGVLLLVFGLIWLWCAVSPVALLEDAYPSDGDEPSGARLSPCVGAADLQPHPDMNRLSLWMSPAEEIYARLDQAAWDGPDSGQGQRILVEAPGLPHWQEWRN